MCLFKLCCCNDMFQRTCVGKTCLVVYKYIFFVWLHKGSFTLCVIQGKVHQYPRRNVTLFHCHQTKNVFSRSGSCLIGGSNTSLPVYEILKIIYYFFATL